jgi:hypothetical protein
LPPLSLYWQQLAAIAPTPACAQSESLKGLTGVHVGVLIDDAITKQHPGFSDAIQKDVEIKLRVAGMDILPDREIMAKPRLTIGISSNLVFGVMVAFSEPAFLARDRTIRVQAATWVRDGVAMALDENEVRRMIKDTVEEFLSDWIIANPKQRAPAH